MRRRLPTFAAIRAFEAAARHCSMQGASEELSLSISAISHQVKALESYVGTALFERVPGRLTLTATGQAYLADLSRVLDLIEAATARASRQGETNQITIHMFSSLAELWFVPLLKDFHREHPEMRISVVSDPSAADFANGIADIAIVYSPLPFGEKGHFLFADQLSPCCSESYLAENGPIQLPEDLLEHPLIWCGTDPEEWGIWFTAAALSDGKPKRWGEPKRWIEFDVRAGALQAAREGLGIAMGRRPYIDSALGRASLVCPLPVTAQTGCGYGVAIPRRAEHLYKIKTFAAWLTRACQETPKTHSAVA